MSTTARNIRIDDELWASAGERAKAEGTNNSELIRQWLEDYAKGSGGVGDALAYRPRPSLDDQFAEALAAFEAVRAQVRKLTGDRNSGDVVINGVKHTVKSIEPGKSVTLQQDKPAKAAPVKAAAK